MWAETAVHVSPQEIVFPLHGLNIKWQCGSAARFRVSPPIGELGYFPRCEIDILCARFTRSGSCRSTARLLVCGVFSLGDFDVVFVKTLFTSIQKKIKKIEREKMQMVGRMLSRDEKGLDIDCVWERDNIIWLSILGSRATKRLGDTSRVTMRSKSTHSDKSQILMSSQFACMWPDVLISSPWLTDKA